MAPIGILHGPADWHPLVQPVVAVANFAAVEIETPPFNHFKDNLTPEFLAKFPMGHVPAFEGSDGFLLTETTAIMRYIAAQNPAAGLLGTDAHSAALVEQWLSFVETEVRMRNILINQVCRGIYNLKPYNKGLHAFLAARHAEALVVLEAHLTKNTFLVGERVTLPDISLAIALAFAVQITLGVEERKRYPAVLRHLDTVFYMPSIKGALGSEIKYAEKPLTHQPPAKE